MQYEYIVNKMNAFFNKLQDEESKRIFDARFQYFVDRNIDSLEESLSQEAIKYRSTCYSWALNGFYEKHPNKKGLGIFVFGAGVGGRASIRSLRVLGENIVGVVDNNYMNIDEVEGIKVENPESLKYMRKEAIVAVAVTNLEQQMNIYYQLLGMGIPSEDIMMIKSGSIWCDYGKQYFDLDELPINPHGEIFVDAGCFDGMSSVNAKKWANGNLLKVYAFEPDKNSIEVCRNRLEGLGCEYELLNVATWSAETTLTFHVNDSFGYASKVGKGGNETVLANSIDNVLAGKPATYIKLDVEGSELETLKGAVHTIKKYKPKLAVSLYHKPEDIVELPIFIESLGMDYRYYIRHYQTRWCETTLYAF